MNVQAAMAQLNMSVDDSVEACLDAFKASGGILLFSIAIDSETLQAQHFQKDISQVENKIYCIQKHAYQLIFLSIRCCLHWVMTHVLSC